MDKARRLTLAAVVLGLPLLGLAGCASQGYGSGGGFEEYYDDCYDEYCVGYNAYGRAYYRTPQPPTVARGDVDLIDRSQGSTRTVSRDTTTRAMSSSVTATRMSVSAPASSPPAPTTVSRHN
jgi:hypothetical protein